jgi:hypothetical protein
MAASIICAPRKQSDVKDPAPAVRSRNGKHREKRQVKDRVEYLGIRRERGRLGGFLGGHGGRSSWEEGKGWGIFLRRGGVCAGRWIWIRIDKKCGQRRKGWLPLFLCFSSPDE